MAEFRAGAPLLCALNTRSIGGAEIAVVRVMLCLQEWSRSRGTAAPIAHILNDPRNARDLDPSLPLRGFGGRRMDFFSLSAKIALAKANILLLDHPNLHPIGLVARALRPDLPIVQFLRGAELAELPILRSNWWHACTLPIAVKHAVTRFFPVTDYIRDLFSRRYALPPSRLITLHDAVIVDPETPPPLAERPPVILTVCRLQHSKNIHCGIEAFAKIADEFPDYRFDIVGDGDQRSYLEALVRRLGLEDRVHFHGALRGERLKSAYRQARLFLLNASREAFGLVYLEAWNHGLPVVCSHEGGPAEIVEDGLSGLHASPDDPDLVADILRKALRNPDLMQRCADRGRQRNADHFAFPHYRRRLFEQLDDLLSVAPKDTPPSSSLT